MTETLTLTRRGALAFGTAALFAPAVRAAETGDWSTVSAAAAKLVADGVVPGLAIAATRDGRLVHAAGHGLANLETATLVTPDTVFRIGSITKQFTGAALVLLAADGKLSLDDRLSRHLPEVPRAGEISLRQMLNHTSGLGNYTDRKPPEAFFVSARTDYDAKQLLADMVAHTDPLFTSAPGTAWAYSNTAYVLLGLVIERVTRAPYAAFFKQRLFDPAGLTATAVDDAAVLVPHRASGYSGHAGDKAFDNAAYISMTYPGAAGSMRSTVGDLCRWHAALLGGRIVPPDGLKQMLAPARLADGSQPTAIVYATGIKKPVDYGFGLFTESFEGRQMVHHGGGIFGFVSDVRSLPAQRLSLAVLVNTDGSGRPGMGPALKDLENAAMQALLHGRA